MKPEWLKLLKLGSFITKKLIPRHNTAKRSHAHWQPVIKLNYTSENKQDSSTKRLSSNQRTGTNSVWYHLLTSTQEHVLEKVSVINGPLSCPLMFWNFLFLMANCRFKSGYYIPIHMQYLIYHEDSIISFSLAHTQNKHFHSKMLYPFLFFPSIFFALFIF